MREDGETGGMDQRREDGGLDGMDQGKGRRSREDRGMAQGLGRWRRTGQRVSLRMGPKKGTHSSPNPARSRGPGAIIAPLRATEN